MSIILNTPQNAGLVRYLQPRAELLSTKPSLQSPPPGNVDGVHPDIVVRLWDELGSKLAENCRWVLLGAPILVRWDTGIVFAFGTGTVYCLRLTPSIFGDAIQSGYERVKANLDLASIGPEWMFGRFTVKEDAWCSAAFDFAE
jgi:hypothetical protein